MYGYDYFLLAATGATIFWMVVTVFLQKKWHIYTLFVGKKHALTVHIIIMTFVALQMLLLTVLDINSHWLFTMSLWPLGSLIFAASVMLLTGALIESGPGSLVGAEVFKHRHRRGKLWHRYRQPLALGFGGFYLGLALLTGHIAYFFVVAGLPVGFLVMNRVVKQIQP